MPNITQSLNRDLGRLKVNKTRSPVAFEDIALVQRPDLSAQEEILILLHYAGEGGFTRAELARYAKCSQTFVTRALQKLMGPDCRQVVVLPSGKYRLTDLGSKRIREHLPDKLLLR